MDMKEEYPKGAMKDEGDERQMLQLRQMNSLLYYRPSQSSLFSERQQKIQPFQTLNVAPSGTAQVIINSDDFVYGPTSYLKTSLTISIAPSTTVQNVTLANVWGQNGSILNIFQSIRLTHRSGDFCISSAKTTRTARIYAFLSWSISEY